MAAETIGRCTCPLCKGKARLTLARSRLPVLTCNGCNIQLFARSDRSDGLLRALLVPDEQPEPVRVPAEADAVRTGPPVPAPAPAVRTEPPAPAPAMAWGAFPWMK